MTVADHEPCCSSHGRAMDCAEYRRTHFVEIRPCCIDGDRLRAATAKGMHSQEARDAGRILALSALRRAERAHEMACSDPTDPTRRTSYSETIDCARIALNVLDSYDATIVGLRAVRDEMRTLADEMGRQ